MEVAGGPCAAREKPGREISRAATPPCPCTCLGPVGGDVGASGVAGTDAPPAPTEEEAEPEEAAATPKPVVAAQLAPPSAASSSKLLREQRTRVLVQQQQQPSSLSLPAPLSETVGLSPVDPALLLKVQDEQQDQLKQQQVLQKQVQQQQEALARSPALRQMRQQAHARQQQLRQQQMQPPMQLAGVASAHTVAASGANANSSMNSAAVLGIGSVAVGGAPPLVQSVDLMQQEQAQETWPPHLYRQQQHQQQEMQQLQQQPQKGSTF